MKKGDLLWGGIFLALVSLFIFPLTRGWILQASQMHPYLAGLIKFAILASLGDALGKRIVTGRYEISRATIYRGVVWGIIGLMVTLVFSVFMGGAGVAQTEKLLPFAEIPLAQAFFGSAIMNLTFAPVMNTFHRLLDLAIEARQMGASLSFKVLITRIDWPTFILFNWLQVGLFFWLPVHTLIFLLPADLRVAVAAFSSIALGIILSFATKKSSTPASLAREEII
ncbi:hypothetical protein [Enterococcus sp. CSURQ0835]|uniref:hypothetical protein n=1 Tax=Enterococcus sp. CSURQ0835 TaxID=2681394 RepID=UPI00135CC169|nr:hypothetical protein [Enterococcus sp. CSURQ0835]